MTLFRKTTLSGAQLPSSWRAEMMDMGGPMPSDLFALDCFAAADGGGITILLRPDRRHASRLEEMVFQLDGADIRPTCLTPIPRGTRLDFAGVSGAMLQVEWVGDRVSVPVRPFDRGLDGTNAIFAVVQDVDPDVIAEWLRFHIAHQGADAAVLLHRDTPDGSSAYHEDIEEALDDIDGLKQVTWVSCPYPIGHPREGDERARHHAPDAPGKAMLEPLVPDPWRAPIVETAIFEVIRTRFLPTARAVLHLHPSDLVPRDDQEPTVFDVAAETGFLKFSGSRAYPFAVDDPDHPRHADHNCVAFDGSRAENIWCVAPARMPSDAYWRQYRVSVVDPAPESGKFSYWRFMAIRHPGLKVGELVPKTSLVENAALSQLIQTEFGAAPKTPPTPAHVDAADLKNDRILIVTTMKNEGPFILEWLAYHRAIGVTDFLVYTNDCSDGTDRMFDLLDARGVVSHRQNPYRETGEKPQHAAYHDASETDLAAAADWIICMDVDEFINVHVGDGTLHDLFAAVPDANLISLTWRLFGNGDVSGFADTPIIGQFDQAAPHFVRKPHQAWGFKTLFRNLGFYKKFGVHRPKGLRPEYLDQIHWVNGSGRRMPTDILRTGWRSTAQTFGYDLVTLNHYALRSAESFLVKRDRGRVNHVDRDQGLAYWFRMNHNAETDQSMLPKRALLKREMDKLLADPEIAAMHAACVSAHQAKIAELRARDDYAAFFAEITGMRLRSLSRVLGQFGNQVFLEGPAAIPDDFDRSVAPPPTGKAPKK